jgi:RNA polymerase sigma-70 factor (ECF subfamily)
VLLGGIERTVNGTSLEGIHGTSMIAGGAIVEHDLAQVERAHNMPFEDFFALEHARLFRALALVIGDRYEAEDVMQEAFVRLWERWDRISRLEDPTGYLYRTAMNGFRLRLRKATTAARRLISPGIGQDPFEGVDQRERLRRALGSATSRQRTALVLTGVLGLTSEEAGRVMRASPVTVRRLASKAKLAMKRSLEVEDA